MINKIVKSINPITFESKSDIVEKLNYFRGLSKNGLHTLSPEEIEKLRNEFTTFFNINVGLWADTYPTKLFRVTLNKNIGYGNPYKLQKISDLIGPPKEIANFGRCNLKGESIFYAALDFNTAIWETQPKKGDYITVSIWKIKDGKKLNNLFIFDPIKPNLSVESRNAHDRHLEEIKKVRTEYADIFIEIQSFLYDEFTKIVDNEFKLNYLFTSLLSSILFNYSPGVPDFKIESISYPSTKLDHKVTNIAILNSLALERLELTEAIIFTVTETNYDNENKNRPDLIKYSALQTFSERFDFENDRIYWNLKREMEDFMKFENWPKE